MKPKKFSQLKVGTAFTLADPSDEACGQGRLKYVNVKIRPSIFPEDKEKPLVKFKPDGAPDYSKGYSDVLPFNVIALEDGRVRTFFGHETVYPVVVRASVS